MEPDGDVGFADGADEGAGEGESCGAEGAVGLFQGQLEVAGEAVLLKLGADGDGAFRGLFVAVFGQAAAELVADGEVLIDEERALEIDGLRAPLLILVAELVGGFLDADVAGESEDGRAGFGGVGELELAAAGGGVAPRAGEVELVFELHQEQ